MVVLTGLTCLTLALSPAGAEKKTPAQSAAGVEIPKFLRDIPPQPLNFNIPEPGTKNLSHGARLIYLRNPELPLVRLTIHLPGGVSREGRLSDYGKTDLLSAVWHHSGTTGFPGKKFEQQLDELGARLSVNAGLESVSITVTFLRNFEGKILALLNEFLYKSRPDWSVFRTEKMKMLERIRNRNEQPAAIASRKLKEVLYGKKNVLGWSLDPDAVKRFQLEDLKKIQRDTLARSHRVFLLSGGYSFDFPKRLAKLAKPATGVAKNGSPIGGNPWNENEKIIKKYLSEAPYYFQGKQGKKNKDRDYYLVHKPVPQTTILLGSLGFGHNHPDYYALKVGNFILGEGSFNSRMFRVIRSDRGLAYSAYAYYVPYRDHGIFRAFSQTKTASTLTTLELMEELIMGMGQELVSAGEISWAKNSIQNKFIFLFENTHSVVDQFFELERENMPAGFLRDFRKNIGSVTTGEIQSVAGKMFQPRRQAVIIVGDRARVRELWKSSGKSASPLKELEAD